MEFEILFSNDEDVKCLRTDLLPDFFVELNDFYWENFLITIARLLDTHQQGQNLNLTLFTLVEILKENNKEWKELDKQIKDLKEKYKDIINYRRKHLAHYDLDYTTGVKEFNTSTHIQEIHDFLESMLLVINMTREAVGEPQTSGFIMYPGQYKGAKELIRILKNENKLRLNQINKTTENN